MTRHTIGVIGASGWLGLAFSHGMVSTGVIPEERLTLSYSGARPETLFRACWTNSIRELAVRSQTLLVCGQLPKSVDLHGTLSDKLMIFMSSGVSAGELSKRYGSNRIVQALPNEAATVGMSYTPWLASSGVTDADRKVVKRILRSCGPSDEVQDEDQLDYFAGLTGCGPALPALLASAMMEDAVSHGIDRRIARRGVVTLLVGAGRLFDSKPACPNDVVGTFLKYRGITAAAIEAMRSHGFDRAVGEGLDAAFRKCRAATGTDNH